MCSFSLFHFIHHTFEYCPLLFFPISSHTCFASGDSTLPDHYNFPYNLEDNTSSVIYCPNKNRNESMHGGDLFHINQHQQRWEMTCLTTVTKCTSMYIWSTFAVIKCIEFHSFDNNLNVTFNIFYWITKTSPHWQVPFLKSRENHYYLSFLSHTGRINRQTWTILDKNVVYHSSWQFTWDWPLRNISDHKLGNLDADIFNQFSF